MCNWPSVSVEMTHLSEVTIELVVTPSTGIGLTQLAVRIPAGTTVSFPNQTITVESNELAGPLLARFGQYDHGVYRDIGELRGPIEASFLIEPIAKPRPDAITVALPDISVNGRPVRTEPVSFGLSQRPALVGLCQ